jgi:hypothetical protein
VGAAEGEAPEELAAGVVALEDMMPRAREVWEGLGRARVLMQVKSCSESARISQQQQFTKS